MRTAVSTATSTGTLQLAYVPDTIYPRFGRLRHTYDSKHKEGQRSQKEKVGERRRLGKRIAKSQELSGLRYLALDCGVNTTLPKMRSSRVGADSRNQHVIA